MRGLKGLKTKIIGWCFNDVCDVFPASLKVNAALLQRQFMNWLKWLTKMVTRLKEINQLKPNLTLMAKNQSDSLSTPQTPWWFWKTKTAVFYILYNSDPNWCNNAAESVFFPSRAKRDQHLALRLVRLKGGEINSIGSTKRETMWEHKKTTKKKQDLATTWLHQTFSKSERLLLILELSVPIKPPPNVFLWKSLRRKKWMFEMKLSPCVMTSLAVLFCD